MSRWWSSAEESRQVLALVDGSDVEQGVGTAVLGYHGLAAAALEPLTRRTLMDVSAVRHALAGVDLEPVAKALGAATRPVMGDAADRYGEIMADDLHQQAVEATERLLLSLTNTGMPWPTAIERVATVHGVPLERLGQAAAKLGAPALTPLVRADIGDRALMDYAAHRGVRENTVADVSKAMSADAFDPNEHPRGAKGQFRRKPARKQPDTRSLEARVARDARDSRQRRNAQVAERGNVRREMAEEAQVAPRSLMGMLADVFTRDEPKANETVSRLSFRDLQDQKTSHGRQIRNEPDAPVEEVQTGKISSKPIAQTRDEHLIDGERTVLVPKEFADQIVANGVVSGRLEDHLHKLGWMSPDDMKALINQSTDNPSVLDGYVVLEIVDSIPVNGGGRRDGTVQVARSAILRPEDAGASLLDAYDKTDNYSVNVKGNAKHPNRAMRVDHTYKVPVLRVKAQNADSYGRQQDDGPPFTPVSMSFEEAEHPRGAKGRFRNKPDHMEPVVDRRSRAARDARDKRDRRSSRGNIRRELAPPPKQQASLMSILAEKIKSDPLAQDMDSVDELAARRERKTFRQLVPPANDRARSKDKPRSSVFDGLDLKNAQVIALTDGQVLALDQVGQQDVNPLVAMADVLSDTSSMGNDPYSALLRMRDEARSRISIAKKGRHLPMGFTEDESYETSDAAWAAAASFQSALEDGIKDSDYVTWADGGTGMTKMRGKHAIELSHPYVEGFSDEQGNHRYRAKAVALANPMDVPTISLGSAEEMAMIRDGVALPDDFVEGETTFREMAALVGMHPDMINSTPDFMIRTIRPVFGQNDD